MQKDILLTTLNSTYQHCAFGLRYLFANLGVLQERAQIVEFTIAKDPKEIAEALLAYNPKVIGIGVYIWNARQTLDLVKILKKVAPEVHLVLGGPEISYETQSQELTTYADFVIQGEGDFQFAELCRNLMSDAGSVDKKILPPILPDIKQIQLPYDLYSDDDIKNRIIYVEASRGCPYKCEYCLSSLDKSVRSFDLDLFLGEIDKLILRGARQFKFIDRTFNLSVTTCQAILNFFLKRIDLGLFLHFEMVPDRLPVEIRDLIKQFPAGSLQFEIGLQTFNPMVAGLVSRRNDLVKVAENFKYLREQTQVHSHADLIVGLPGEDLQSFANGFNRLVELDPDEIQVGLLKRLKGTPIIRHDSTWQMLYQEHPPYQILSTKTISFSEMQMMSRFAKHWDLYANSGQFPNLIAQLKSLSMQRTDASFFHEFLDFSLYLTKKFPTAHSLSLMSLTQAAFDYLHQEKDYALEEAQQIILADYSRGGRSDIPHFLRNHKFEAQKPNPTGPKPHIPSRQARHL